MQKIKLIVSDIDGTLIPEGSQDFEEGFFESLKKLLNEGYEFYAASGRPFGSLYQIFGDFADRIHYISDNGILVVENGELVFQDELDQALAEEVARDVLSMPEAEIFFSGVEKSFMMPKTEWFIHYVKDVFRFAVKEVKCREDVDETIIKLSFFVHDFEKNGERILKFFNDKYRGRATVVSSGNGWIDLIEDGFGKGKALRHVMKRKNIRPEEVLVFGDNQNDVSMFQGMPNSYAKSNSTDAVKAEAQYVCDSVIEVWKEKIFR